MECFLLKIFSHELTSPAPLIIKKMSNLKSTFFIFRYTVQRFCNRCKKNVLLRNLVLGQQLLFT